MIDKPLTQAEKAAIVAEDRRNATLLGRAQLEMEQFEKGRFARSANITAAEAAPVAYPAADWTRADPGLEPVLGYSIEDQEPTGEIHERESIRRADIIASTPPEQQRGERASVVADHSNDAGAEAGSLPLGLPASPIQRQPFWRSP